MYLLRIFNLSARPSKPCLCLATLREVDELFLEAENKGLVKSADYIVWRGAVGQMGGVALDAHNLVLAKRCFLRMLAWPRSGVMERLQGLQFMARYHRECKD